MGEDKKKKLLRKKALTLALMYMFFCMSSHINASIEKERNFAYELCDSSSRSNDKPFATYKNYNIYIGCEADINRYTSDPNNICIIDGRCNKNPNMKIIDSYRITSTEDMFNILAVLQEYEKIYPTRWNRSLEGLQIEWVAHNISFQYGIFPVRSGSVDLDNLDGFLYEDAGIKLIFGK